MTERSADNGLDQAAGFTPHPVTVLLHRYRFGLLAAILLVVISFDQSTKLWVRGELARALPEITDEAGNSVVHYRGVREIRLIDGIFHLRYVENPAAAFSLTRSIPLKWRRPLLIGVSYLAMILLLAWFAKLKQPDVLLLVGLSLVLGGAIGNAIDRHWHTYVIDFVDWRLTRFWPRLPPWPTWNIADGSIVCGAGTIVFRSFFPYERRFEKKGAKVGEAKPAEASEA